MARVKARLGQTVAEHRMPEKMRAKARRAKATRLAKDEARGMVKVRVPARSTK